MTNDFLMTHEYMFYPSRFINNISKLPLELCPKCVSDGLPFMFGDLHTIQDEMDDVLLFAFISGANCVRVGQTDLELYPTIKGAWIQRVCQSRKISLQDKILFIKRLISQERLTAFYYWKITYTGDLENY